MKKRHDSHPTATPAIIVAAVATLGASCVNELSVDPVILRDSIITADFVDQDTTMVGKTDTVRLRVTREGVPLTGVQTRFVPLDPNALRVRHPPLTASSTTADSINSTMLAEVTYLKRGSMAFKVFFDFEAEVIDSGFVEFDIIQERWQHVSAGNGHTCAVTLARFSADSLELNLRQGGEVFCWGTGVFGALGTGFSQQEPFPARARTTGVFARVQAGERFSCGTDQIGLLYCWGDNLGGQLGLGHQLDQFVPRLVNQAESNHDYDVSKATLFTCGVKTTRVSTTGTGTEFPGFTFCWGQNFAGQLGCGTGPACDSLQLLQPNTATPTTVVDSLENQLLFTTVTAGGEHACGLDLFGTAYCWGDNSIVQLGIDPAITQSRFARPVSAPQFAFLSASQWFTCGVTVSVDEVYCWGAGIGGNPSTPTPTAVTGIPAGNISLIETGSQHACVLMDTGTAHCWGENSNGQLGNGTVDPSASPTPVSGNLEFVLVTAGDTHTCGITREPLDIRARLNDEFFPAELFPSGALYCWGGNDSGQLGTDAVATGENSLIPVRIEEPFPDFF